LSDAFEREFGRVEDLCASAPGRVNLIGEHTDYNGGFVLPMALPLQTHAYLTRRDDRTVEVQSLLIPGANRASYQIGGEQPGRGWLDYVQGVTATLSAGGCAIAGFDLLLASNVPVGRGLSSSAALQVSVTRALRRAYFLNLDDVEVAMVAHRAETEFVGAPVGIMDQMVCSLARPGQALFIDAREVAFEHVQLPGSAAVAVIDSGIAHHHASGQYRTRRMECDEAAARLGVSSLRDLTDADSDRCDSLPDVLRRRVRHVVTENRRVPAMVEALRAADLEAAGDLLRRSHASMRDDFEISLPAIDVLVALANERPEIYGARMTGGGFGGAVVLLGRPDSIQRVAKGVATEYERATGHAGGVLIPALNGHIS
jgi:galactokinase